MLFFMSLTEKVYSLQPTISIIYKEYNTFNKALFEFDKIFVRGIGMKIINILRFSVFLFKYGKLWKNKYLAVYI